MEIKKFTLSEEEFNKLRKLVFDKAGISLSDSKRELVISRFSRRLRLLELNSFLEYFDLLISPHGSNEIQNFINSITTNKTDFFREIHHFDFIKDGFIPEIVMRGQKEIKIWSAGCSTGEEPYTIAMVMDRHLVEKHGVTVKILATDIDTNVLNIARNAVYADRIVSPIPEHYLKKYFLRGKEENKNLYKVKDHIRKMITFKQLNFIAKKYPIKTKFDIIFCRNVIIYFNADTKKYVVNRINDYLAPNGYFIIGHSETLFDMVDDLKYVKNTVYRKV